MFNFLVITKLDIDSKVYILKTKTTEFENFNDAHVGLSNVLLPLKTKFLGLVRRELDLDLFCFNLFILNYWNDVSFKIYLNSSTDKLFLPNQKISNSDLEKLGTNCKEFSQFQTDVLKLISIQ